MKTILFFLFAVLVFGLVSCNNPTSNRGLVINEVRWATSNVETSGTFARNPESAGGHFTWEEAQNACPRGWRLPTARELELLVDADRGWITRNGVYGHLFGEIFLPAAGFRRAGNDALNAVGSSGLYWSSTPVHASAASRLHIGGGGGNYVFGSNHSNEFSVRCVAE